MDRFDANNVEDKDLHLFCRNIEKEKHIYKPVTFLIHKNDKYVFNQDTELIKEINKSLIER